MRTKILTASLITLMVASMPSQATPTATEVQDAQRDSSTVEEICLMVDADQDICSTFAGCDETSGAGVGSLSIDGAGDVWANGSWINGCGGDYHDDQATGHWIGDGADAGTWSVSETRLASGQRTASCSITGIGFDDLVWTIGKVEPDDGAVGGNCGGSFDETYSANGMYTFDLHTPLSL